MLVEKISKDEVNTRSLQRETSEITSLLNQFPANTNVLVVDTNFTTLLNMKQMMRQYGYQVTIEADGEKALAFLTSCKHEINIVIWDFHMPGIGGLEALKSIGSKMDLPVVVMSDDNQTESVMKATIHGACDYILKPVKEDVIANIWQHIVRKRMMSKPDTISPVQSYLVQSDGLEQGNQSDGLEQVTVDSKIVDQEQNIDKKEERAAKKPWITWTKEIQPVQSDLVQIYDLDQYNNYYETINQDNGEQNIDKKDEKATKRPRMILCDEEFQFFQSDLVHQTDGFNQDNIVQKIEKKVGKRTRKPRMTWTENLHQKFLEAIEIIGGIEKANPKRLMDCLQEMKIEGLTRNNVASHLQKHRISLEENQILQQTQEIGWSSAAYGAASSLQGSNNVASHLQKHRTYLEQIPQQTQEISWSNAYEAAPSLQGSNNVHTTISPYLINGQAVNPIQQNKYQNGYLTMNNNQFMTNSLTRLPYNFDNHLCLSQQQQYQSSPQFNYVMSNEALGIASGIYAPDLELTYPSFPYK